MTRRRSGVGIPEANINITSMLDVVFVLLIAFMVVAPAIKFSVDLDLPKVRKGNDAGSKRPIVLQVIPNGDGSARYAINGEDVAFENIPDFIKSTSGYGEDSAISLEGDKTASWESIASLINLLKMNDINRIGIITERATGT